MIVPVSLFVRVFKCVSLLRVMRSRRSVWQSMVADSSIVSRTLSTTAENTLRTGIDLYARHDCRRQYAFEQVKLDRKGYDTRRLQKYLSFLADAGAYFSEEALQRADDLINNFTADFGHDEDGDATFRIKAQSYRLKEIRLPCFVDMINPNFFAH